jgi:hypothetical protein
MQPQARGGRAPGYGIVYPHPEGASAGGAFALRVVRV